MTGLGGVDKHGRGPGRRQGGSHLAPDVATFAHAHDNHATLDLQDHRNRLPKRCANTGLETQDGGGLDVQRFLGQKNGTLGLSLSVWFGCCRHRFILSGTFTLSG